MEVVEYIPLDVLDGDAAMLALYADGVISEGGYLRVAGRYADAFGYSEEVGQWSTTV